MLSISTVALTNAPLESLGFQIENGIVNSVLSKPEKSANGIVYSTNQSLSSVPV